MVQQLPQQEYNAPLFLFSASGEQVAYGAQHFGQRSEDTSTVLHQLFKGYQREGIDVPYTMADFKRDFIKENLDVLSPEERLKGMSREEIARYLAKLDAEAAATQKPTPARPPRSKPKHK